ncbi:sulfotransferase 1 [Branchiostoma belcheri]|nr:sulfotransferase 1 [Branchiostoma belcheri]
MRNPKDTAVSYFHFEQKRRAYFQRKPIPSWDEFFQLFLAGKHTFGCYFDHVLGWWQRRDDPHFLFLKYEDMKKDLPNAVRTVATFLKVKLDDASIETIAHACTFSNMKAALDKSLYDDRTFNARKEGAAHPRDVYRVGTARGRANRARDERTGNRSSGLAPAKYQKYTYG